jgi:hypothetical protein
LVESFFDAHGVPSYLLLAEKWMWFGGMACGTWRSLVPDDVAEALTLARSMLASNPKHVHLLLAALGQTTQTGRLDDLEEFVLPTRMQALIERSHKESKAQGSASSKRRLDEDV